jgi:hypothetical protein
MPNKRPSVKNEKQYEALKDKDVEGAGGQDRQLPERLLEGREEVRLRVEP